MGDLAADTKVTGSVGRYSARLSRDWEIWGPNGGYIASIALRAAGAHSRFGRPVSIVGHFLGVADLRRRPRRGQDAARHQAGGVDAGVDETERDADLRGAGVDVRPDGRPRARARPDPGDVRSRVGARRPRSASRPRASSPMYRFWSNFDERIRDRGSTRDEWLDRTPAYPGFERWYRFLPTSTFDDLWVDACRSLILVDTLGWPAVSNLHIDSGYIAPSIDISCAFHRARIHEPWLFAQATSVSANAGVVGCEGTGLVARRRAARDGHQPAALPPDSRAVESAPWKTASRRGSTSR